jgi:type II secretory pathway component PulC
MVAAAGSPNDYATLGRTGPVAPYSDVNPFKPPVEPTPPPSNPPPTRPVQPSTNTNTASALPSGPWLPNTGAVRPSNPAPPVRQDEPPLPLITLKGIVTGNPVIAILETNGQTQYRQTGETVTPGVRIGKISETSVVMELKGKRPVTLEVGRSIGGAPASAVPGGSTQPPPTSDPVPAAKPVVPEASSEPSASSITASAEPVKKPVRRYRRRAAPVRFVGRRL